MKITNTYDLPEPIYLALCHDTYERAGRFSASELPSPPQMRALKLRHADAVVKDASDMLWLLQGKSIHKVIEDMPATSSGMCEKELVHDLGDGNTVSGTSDLYTGTGEVVDWKVTSVWSFLLGGLKPEWEAQLNTYGWLWRRAGFSVSSLAIYAILRDWQKSKAGDGDYPPIPFRRIPVPLWPDEQVDHYVRNRVGLHLLAESLPDDQLPPCTPEDQWAKETSYAVKKRGQVKAVRVLASREEADALARSTVNGYVEVRPGKRTRCEEYCDAAPFCCQYRAEHPDEDAPLLAGAGKAVAP